jgi:transcriptional regulator with XRE-family HTH domain
MQGLGDFVRSRRRALSAPNSAGRPRRTPGLRREELAAKAGISPTWCAWIEQGRIAGISAKALSRLAYALELSEDDRAALFELSEKEDPEKVAHQKFAAPDSVKSLVLAVSSPAYALDNLWNAVCWNPGAMSIFPGWLGDDCDRSMLRYVLLNREARAISPQWETWARHTVQMFRSDLINRPNDPVAEALIRSLARDSSAFSAMWDSDLSFAEDAQILSFKSADSGKNSYIPTKVAIPNEIEYSMMIYTPVTFPAAKFRNAR